MPRKRFTPEEIIQHLRTVEVEQSKGTTFEEAARKIGVTPQTVARWKNEYGGLRVDQAKRMKELEQENQRLHKIVSNLNLDIAILKEVARGNF